MGGREGGVSHQRVKISGQIYNIESRFVTGSTGVGFAASLSVFFSAKTFYWRGGGRRG